MQFKHPEILWALFLLLIPIIIHLFQLRRFKRTPFTNVAMLQKVVSESRKSSTLKKWLLLLTRLALLVALIIAFAQPFSAKTTALKPKETVIYLDNSFSMQAKASGFSLLENAVQQLFKNIDPDAVFSLFTNDRTFRNVTLKDVQNDLLSLQYTQTHFDLAAARLKAGSLFSNNGNTTKELILLSDFQRRTIDSVNSGENVVEYFVQLTPDESNNIQIDSMHLSESATSQIEINARLSGAFDENIPISLFNGNQLIAKTSVNFDTGGTAQVQFSVPEGQQLNGTIEINDQGLAYDNTFYFNINTPERIKVLAISGSDGAYLEKLFGSEEFVFSSASLPQLNYSQIDKQNLVVLNGLESIPASLQKVLKGFHDNGGSLIVIPTINVDIVSYNLFLSSFGRIFLKQRVPIKQNISQIAFDHPLYQNVFERRVTNFQYPSVSEYFSTESNLSAILSFQGGDPFLLGRERFYLLTASIASENSNFKNSPLIVPTFDNIASTSLKNPELYFILGRPAATDVGASLGKDNILRLEKNEESVIPRQQSFNNRVRLNFDENPKEAGIYAIRDNDSIYKYVSFNYARNESQLQYPNLDNYPDLDARTSIQALFDHIKSEGTITPYWKWFVIFALLFALVEIAIQKIIA